MRKQCITIVVSGNEEILGICKEKIQSQNEWKAAVHAIDPRESNFETNVQELLVRECGGAISTVDFVVIENLSVLPEKDYVLEEARAIHKICLDTDKSMDICVAGYFLIPDTFHEADKEEEYANTYAALQGLENNVTLEEPVYDDIVLISGQDDETASRVSEMLVSFGRNGTDTFGHRELYRDWKQVKAAFLEDKSILSEGLLKSNIFPESAHSYCSMGYAAAQFSGETAISDGMANVKRHLFDKVNGRGWTRLGEKVGEELIEEQLKRLLNLEPEEDFEEYWEKFLVYPLKKCAVLEESQVELTRSQINGRDTKAYAESYNTKARVKKGIKEVCENIQKIANDIVENAEPILEQYGPGMMAELFSGNTNISLEKILHMGTERLAKVKGEKERRPAYYIVGMMSEEELRQDIAEWKADFRRALETEIRAEIADYFLAEESEWEHDILCPVREFIGKCEEMAVYLQNETGTADTAVEEEQLYRINLDENREFTDWMKEKVSGEPDKAVIKELKRRLIHGLLEQSKGKTANKKESENYISEILSGNELKRQWTLVDYFQEFEEGHTEEETVDMMQSFIRAYLPKLLSRSELTLKMDIERRRRKTWLVFPEKILNVKYNAYLRQEIFDFLEREAGQDYEIVPSENENEILCYQSSVANPLYGVSGIQKWEQCYNQRIETGKAEFNWKSYVPLALRHLERNAIYKKIDEEFFSPCIDYALKEKIIERKRFPGEEWKYLYVMNLIPDSWTNLNVSNYKVGDAEGRAQKGEAFFQYLHSMNSFSADVWQREITLPDAGVFSRAYDFSDAPEGMDIDGISISYMKRILQKNVPLFVLLRQTVKKYMRMQRDIDELRIAPAQTGKQAPEDTGMHRTEKPLQTDPPVVKKMKYCKFCGKELKTGVEKFCPKCGRQLRE